MKKYLSFLSKSPVILLIIYLVLQYIFVAFILNFLLAKFGTSERKDLSSLPLGLLFFVGVFISPILETIACQVMPYFVLKKLKSPPWLCFVGMWLTFAFLHFKSSLATMLVAGVAGGFFFSLSYFLKASESTTKAYFLTSICHSLSNASVIIILMINPNAHL